MPSVAFVVFDGFHAMSLAAQPVFSFANQKFGESFYEVLTLSEHGAPVRPIGGPTVMTEPFEERTFDTVLFTGGDPGAARLSYGLLAYARHSAATARRVAAICTGAFVLAEAGLLDGKRATTHWVYASALRKHFPRIRVEEDRIYAVDGSCLSRWSERAGSSPIIAVAQHDSIDRRQRSGIS